jgi:hypothetical protein
MTPQQLAEFHGIDWGLMQAIASDLAMTSYQSRNYYLSHWSNQMAANNTVEFDNVLRRMSLYEQMYPNTIQYLLLKLLDFGVTARLYSMENCVTLVCVFSHHKSVNLNQVEQDFLKLAPTGTTYKFVEIEKFKLLAKNPDTDLETLHLAAYACPVELSENPALSFLMLKNPEFWAKLTKIIQFHTIFVEIGFTTPGGDPKIISAGHVLKS